MSLKKYKCQDKVVEVTGEKLTRRKTLKTFVWISSTNSASVQVPTWCPHQRHTAVIMEHNERCTATDVGKQNMHWPEPKPTHLSTTRHTAAILKRKERAVDIL